MKIKKFFKALKIGYWVLERERQLGIDPLPNQLGKQQERFALMYCLLLLHAFIKGYQIRLGDVWARSGHKKNSFHYKKLAGDINLFTDDFFLKDTNDHKILGEYWKYLQGSWGGDFRKKDGNHYSLGEI